MPTQTMTVTVRNGLIHIKYSHEGLVGIDLRDSLKRPPSHRQDAPTGLVKTLWLKDAISRLRSYFAKNDSRLEEIPFDFSTGSRFQKEVWEACRKIRFGEVRSYSWIAEKVGKPQSQRAVGQALGRNPLPLVVPCHRVIRADGGLGGFSAGLDIKRALLSIEGH
ncbi:methylated-DNA--[protein]-cysteine S-methyltransferase [Candidatus Hydrogenedentota bacterium]